MCYFSDVNIPTVHLHDAKHVFDIADYENDYHWRLSNEYFLTLATLIKTPRSG